MFYARHDLGLRHGVVIAPAFDIVSDGTFIRASEATDWNYATNAYSSFALNERRIQNDRVLIEEQRANVIKFTHKLDFWTGAGSVNTDTEVSPDGTSTADVFVKSAANGLCEFNQPNSVATTPGSLNAFSAFGKIISGGPDLAYRVSWSGGVPISGTMTFNGQWGRQLAVNAHPVGSVGNSTGGYSFGEWSETADYPAGNYALWGGQVEEAPYASSYIHNVTPSALSRLPDDFTIPASTFLDAHLPDHSFEFQPIFDHTQDTTERILYAFNSLNYYAIDSGNFKIVVNGMVAINEPISFDALDTMTAEIRPLAGTVDILNTSTGTVSASGTSWRLSLPVLTDLYIGQSSTGTQHANSYLGAFYSL